MREAFRMSVPMSDEGVRPCQARRYPSPLIEGWNP